MHKLPRSQSSQRPLMSNSTLLPRLFLRSFACAACHQSHRQETMSPWHGSLSSKSRGGFYGVLIGILLQHKTFKLWNLFPKGLSVCSKFRVAGMFSNMENEKDLDSVVWSLAGLGAPRESFLKYVAIFDGGIHGVFMWECGHVVHWQLRTLSTAWYWYTSPRVSLTWMRHVKKHDSKQTVELNIK